MKKTIIIISIVLFVLSIIYAFLFMGSESFSYSSKHKIFNANFRTINLPLVKYERGFLSYKFYVKDSWEENASELSFEVNYRTGTVTFNNTEAWNEVIQSLHVEKPRLIKNNYKYFYLDHGFFYDLKYDFLSYRLLEDPMDRQLIILKSDAVLKISL